MESDPNTATVLNAIRIPQDQDAYLRYPETSLFDFDPPPKNLTPPRELENNVDEKALTKYREELQEPPCNPLTSPFGDPPIHSIDVQQIKRDKLPDKLFPAYGEPSSLPEIQNGDEMIFLHQLKMEDTVTSEHRFFVVVFESTQWLLKAFIDDSNFFAYSEEPGFEEHQSIAQFKRERDSYAHFRHYKIADGSVPKCRGWVSLSKEQIFDLAEKFDCWKNRKDAPYELPVHGILTEYFPDAAFLSISNVNFALAESAMRGLCNIHGCYVLHNDPATRNCLVVSEDRVVWVDFDRSCTPGDPDVTGPVPARSSYWDESLRVLVSHFRANILESRRGNGEKSVSISLDCYNGYDQEVHKRKFDISLKL